jgi:hypothetical protein
MLNYLRLPRKSDCLYCNHPLPLSGSKDPYPSAFGFGCETTSLFQGGGERCTSFYISHLTIPYKILVLQPLPMGMQLRLKRQVAARVALVERPAQRTVWQVSATQRK